MDLHIKDNVDASAHLSPSSGISPHLSVIVCTYNRRNAVLSALASLRRQTLSYDEFEVIVVDNGSTDGTLNAVRQYVNAGHTQQRRPEDTWRVSCVSEAQHGLAYARNTALQAASGEIAVFLDVYTSVDPHFLEAVLTAYHETGADALGGPVDLRWAAERPHWLTDNLLELLGYFAPAKTRMPLPAPMHFSSSSFSVRIAALRAIGSFSLPLDTHLSIPARMEVDDLCRRLRQKGYTLWYEPTASATQHVPTARLKRPYFVGQAYWQGRSEVATDYAAVYAQQDTHTAAVSSIMRAIVREVGQIARIALLEHPLLILADKPTQELLLLDMAQARTWGHLHQHVRFLNHAPQELQSPEVLLVHPAEPDVAITLLTQALLSHDVCITQSSMDISIAWLWQHRAHGQNATAILHLYKPGAYDLTSWQRQRLCLLLWLARHWGIRVVCTDTGGWWHNGRSPRFLTRRTFERMCFQLSDIVLAYTRQPKQLYPDNRLRRRVHCLPHPGFRNALPPLILQAQAHKQLGIPPQAGCVYLCFAHLHSEREIIHLIQAFSELETEKAGQLILVGSPKEKAQATRLLQQAALYPAIHVFLADACVDDLPLYIGAAHTIVIPHLPVRTAGVLETAMMALSYERFVIVPDLPRFRGMLPSSISAFYDPSRRTSLTEAMANVQTTDYSLRPREVMALDAEKSWNAYAKTVIKVYRAQRIARNP